jgi:hypothetical protein
VAFIKFGGEKDYIYILVNGKEKTIVKENLKTGRYYTSSIAHSHWLENL